MGLFDGLPSLDFGGSSIPGIFTGQVPDDANSWAKDATGIDFQSILNPISTYFNNQKNEQNKIIDTIGKAGDEALAWQNQQYKDAKALQTPYQSIGNMAISQLTQGAGYAPNTSPSSGSSYQVDYVPSATVLSNQQQSKLRRIQNLQQKYNTATSDAKKTVYQNKAKKITSKFDLASYVDSTMGGNGKFTATGKLLTGNPQLNSYNAWKATQPKDSIFTDDRDAEGNIIAGGNIFHPDGTITSKDTGEAVGIGHLVESAPMGATPNPAPAFSTPLSDLFWRELKTSDDAMRRKLMASGRVGSTFGINSRVANVGNVIQGEVARNQDKLTNLANVGIGALQNISGLATNYAGQSGSIASNTGQAYQNAYTGIGNANAATYSTVGKGMGDMSSLAMMYGGYGKSGG